MRELIRKYALQNAVFFNGKATPGAVIGKVFAEKPELKSRAKEVGRLAAEVVCEVNKLSLQKQKAELEAIDASLLVKDVKDETKELPELHGVTGKVVMRFAPNPNGPLHIGHSRQALLNDEYVKKYGGTYILRFDDTDPKTPNKRPMTEAYEMIQKDLEWLGVQVNRIEYASSRVPVYIAHFEKLVKMGKGYVCTCDPEIWRWLRREGKACPCREQGPKLWEKMRDGGFAEGEAVARVKTDLAHPDPAARDWAALRIIDSPDHPRVGNKFKLWPMLDFASAIDDHDFGITHIIRGKDLNISEVRQRFLYDYFNWTYPVAETTGKLFVEGAVTSKSKIKEGIASGKYSGWDDPQLVTLQALRRRGFPPETIREFVVEMGLKPVNATLDMGALEVMVKRAVDGDAKRMFFVPGPEEICVKGAPDLEVEISFYPKDDHLGSRKFSTNGRFFIPGQDAKPGRARLKDLYNIIITEKVTFDGDQLSEEDRRSLRKIQWVPVDSSRDARLLLTDGSVMDGKIESSVTEIAEDEIVQLERVGFARLESKNPVVFLLTAR